jgi:hypothetical protein
MPGLINESGKTRLPQKTQREPLKGMSLEIHSILCVLCGFEVSISG